jgi:hypothetical protein
VSLLVSCTEYHQALSDLIDGSLEGDARTRVESHVRDCADCRQLLADLRHIRESARALPRVDLPEFLWHRVGDAVEREGRAAAHGAPAPGRSRWTLPVWWPAWGTLAAAATLVLAASLAGYFAMRPQQKAEPAAHVTATDTVQSVESELDAADKHYEKAIAALELVAKDGRSALDPKTEAVVRKSLGVIDQAILESRAALKAQPTSEVAQATLFEALQRKVGLLRDTIALVNEMRKGNQTGAATIVGSLGKS